MDFPDNLIEAYGVVARQLLKEGITDLNIAFEHMIDLLPAFKEDKLFLHIFKDVFTIEVLRSKQRPVA